MPKGNTTQRRGHRSRAAVVRHEGVSALRLAEPSPAEVEQLRSWAKQVSTEELEAAQRAVRSLLSVVAGEQADRAQVDDAADLDQAKGIVDELRNA